MSLLLQSLLGILYHVASHILTFYYKNEILYNTLVRFPLRITREFIEALTNTINSDAPSARISAAGH